MHNTNQGTNPETVLKKLLEGNFKYVENRSPDFEKLKLKQTPKVTMLTCCDSRVPQNLFNIDGLNEIFTVRNIGNQFKNSEGSVKYPIMHLHTPLLIVVGHTGCGAISASLSDYRGEDSAIQKEVIGLVDSKKLADKTTDASEISDVDQKLALYSQANVDYQVIQILSDPALKAKVQKQELCVVGMVFDIHGVFNGDCANVYIININGITDEFEMKRHKVAAEIGIEQSNLRIRRLQYASSRELSIEISTEVETVTH